MGASPCHSSLAERPQRQRHQHQPGLQQGGGGGEVAVGQCGLGHPAGDLHGKGGRGGGTKDLRHVHIGHRIGQHRQHRQPQRRIQCRHHRQQEARDIAIAKAARHLQAPMRAGLRQGGKRHDQQEGQFLEHQPQRQSYTVRIIQDQQIRRLLPASGPRRQQAGDPAGRGDQKGQPQRGCGMGDRQQRRQAGLYPSEQGAVGQGGEDQ